MRHMRPWGHIGLTFTQGLPWSLAMLLTHPADGIGAAYIGAYALSRLAITWLVGAWGLQQRELWKKMPLVFVWDASAFFIWLLSFGRRRIRWRNVDYRIRDRKSTRLNSSHTVISYAVFCLKKKKKNSNNNRRPP